MLLQVQTAFLAGVGSGIEQTKALARTGTIVTVAACDGASAQSMAEVTTQVNEASMVAAGRAR